MIFLLIHEFLFTDFDRINSNSPPNRQARVNPFLKDMPKAKTHDAAEAKKLQEALTHPLELPKEDAQSDEECEPLQQGNNNNVVQEKLPVAAEVQQEQQQQHHEIEQQHEEKVEKPSTDLQNGNKSVENVPEIVQSEEPQLEGDGIVQEQLPPGKVVRRKKSTTQTPNNGETTSNNNNNNQVKRASVAKMEGLGAYLDVNSSIMSSSTEVEGAY